MFSNSNEIDGYGFSNESDDENALNSSEEEDKIDDLSLIFQANPQHQKKHAFQQIIPGEQLSSSEDEFEELMKSQLDFSVCEAEQTWYSSSKNVNSKEEDERNSELMYDPQADDEDQKWVDNNKVKKAGTAGRKRSEMEANSDAVLNCPSCFVTLCRDCQRHSKYKNQYRAMFVTNCTVNYDQSIKMKSTAKNKKKVFKRHRKKAERAAIEMASSSCVDSQTEKKIKNNFRGFDLQQNNEEEQYHPVNCSQCKTEVGVYDKDEVYHFFNVFASY